MEKKCLVIIYRNRRKQKLKLKRFFSAKEFTLRIPVKDEQAKNEDSISYQPHERHTL